MPSSRSGFLTDPFDPICAQHLSLCEKALSRSRLRRVLLPVAECPSAGASLEHRWRMAVAACAGREDLVPVLLPGVHLSAGVSVLAASLRSLFPEEEMVPLPVPEEARAALSAAGRAVRLGDLSPCCPSVREYCALLGLCGGEPRLPSAASWLEKLFAALRPHRFAHSLSVAAVSRDLALRFGADPVRAEAAGLLHDCAKCLPLPQMQQLALSGGQKVDPEVLSSSALLHSVAGARLLRLEYGISDPEILEAVAFHNTGAPGMSRLAMCVCLGDFIEPNRSSFPLLEEVRRLAASSLEKALLLSLEGTMEHVLSSGKYLHPKTKETVAWLRSLPAVQA